MTHMNIKEFFKKLNWFERIFPVVAIIIIVVSFAVQSERNWLSLTTSLMGIIAFFCVAKGFFIAPILSICQSVLYLILSVSQNFYGEMILAAFYIILNIFTIFLWIKNRNKEDRNYVEVNKINKYEYILIFPVLALVGLGCYFMLKAFNTSELLTSTFSMMASLASAYLVLRRSSYYSVGYIINDVIVVVLWSLTIKNVGLEFLPTIVGSALYFVNDIYGLVNWKIMEKKQNSQIQVAGQNNISNAKDSNVMWHIPFDNFDIYTNFT